MEEEDLISPLVALSKKFQYYAGQDSSLATLHCQVPLRSDFQDEAG